jgi:uncharacterized membrane protein
VTSAIVVVSVVLTGLFAGNELATLTALHPALRALPLPAQIAAERALTYRLRQIMPVVMTTTLVVTAAAAAALAGDPGFGLAVVATVALAAMLAITLLGNMPLNLRTEAFPTNGDAAEWRSLRSRWERLHVVRVVLDLLAFACLIAALQQTGP